METVQKRRPEKQPAAATPQDAVMGWKAMAATEKPLTPGECGKHLRKTVAAAYRDIVTGFVNEAKEGSCQHLKLATEIVQPKKRVRTSRGKGPAEQLMEELGLE